MSKSPITYRIDCLLKQKGISKAQFYKDCEITSAAYSLWNQEKTQPSMKNLSRIAEYLAVNVGYILDGGEIGNNQKQNERTIDRINLLLAETGKTGAELSRDLGLSTAVYSQWNTGKTVPSARVLKDISDYFSVSIEYLKCTSDSRTQKEKPTVKDDGLDSEAIKLSLSKMSVDELWAVIVDAQNELKGRSSNV